MVFVYKVSAAAIMALTIAGCAASPASLKDGRALSQDALPDISNKWSSLEAMTSGTSIDWVARLNDPVLSAFAKEAEIANPGLKAAEARIAQARGLTKLSGASLAPSVAAGLSSEGSGLVDGGSASDLGVAISLNWEADLWGRLRSRQTSAQQSQQAVEADFLGARNLLAASVSEAYFLIVETSGQLQIAEDTVTAVTEIERIAKARHDDGLASPQDLAIARGDLATAKERVKEIRGANRQALRALETLLGRYPSAKSTLPSKLPQLPGAVPVGIPSQILERRPDIVAAERRVAASLNALGEARTAQLPRLTLTGEIGGASDDLSAILSPSNLAWQAASSLLAPIFAGGALQAQVDINAAAVDESVAAYAETALAAFSEVETALDLSSVLSERAELLATSGAEANTAYDIAKIRYQEGETDLLDVLMVQQRVFTARSAALNVQRQQLQKYISLNLALGGDWSS